MSVATTTVDHVAEFYRREVLPALIDQLDVAFPEFHWRRTSNGWVADNQHNYIRAGGRPHELVTCIDPEGFSISERPGMTWLAYVNGGRTPQGAEFVSAVHHLAELVGVDAVPLRYFESTSVPTVRHGDQHRKLIDAFFHISKEMLDDDAKAEGARQYLMRLTGLDAKEIRQLPLGYYTNAEDMRARLLAAGFQPEEIDDSALLCHEQLTHCVVGPARYPRGPITTFFALELSNDGNVGRRYLNLGGGSRPVVFGLDVALSPKAAGCNELTIVRGLIEAVSLHQRGIRNVVAIAGGPSLMTIKRWKGLARHGVRRVTLAVDREVDVQESLRAAAESLVQSGESPIAYVLEPGLLGDCDTWHQWFLRANNADRRNIFSKREHLFHLHARVLLERHRPSQGWTETSERDALLEALKFDSTAAEPRIVELDKHFWPVLIGELPLATRLASLRQKTNRVVHAPPVNLLNYEDSTVSEASPLPSAPEPPRSRPNFVNAPPTTSSVIDDLRRHEARLANQYGQPSFGLTQRTLPSLDRSLNGLKGLVLLAGGPRVDKLSLAVQLGIDAVTHHEDALFCCFSFDQPKQHVLNRILCRLAGVDWHAVVRPDALQNGHAMAHRDRLAAARDRLAQLGSRIVIVNREECPVATAEGLQQHLEAAERSAGARRAIVVVDDLASMSLSRVTDTSRHWDTSTDDWPIDQLRRLRDTGDDRTVIGLCDADTTVPITDEPTGSINNRRGRYAANAALVLRPFDSQETRAYFSRLLFPSVVESRWLAKLQEQGVELNKLVIAKGDDNRQLREIELAFFHRRFSFTEDIPMWGIDR